MHSHNPHTHNPHSHNPHTHGPHTHGPHDPHTHDPHTHTPHNHNTHNHNPFDAPNPCARTCGLQKRAVSATAAAPAVRPHAHKASGHEGREPRAEQEHVGR